MAFTCLSSTVTSFAPSHNHRTHASQLNAIPPESIVDPTITHLLHHALTSSPSTILSTIDSDIASIPDDQFRKVFAGGGLIMLGSVLSTIFVGFLIDSNNAYADLVAETYAGQDLEEEESFLDSLSFDQRREAEEMVYDFREKKAKKAGTWTEEDERLKMERLLEEKKMGEESGGVGEKDVFSDYD
jgi:hypothetical protein